MLKVFLTTDVEVWCGDWRRLQTRFATAFRRHIYGSTPNGDYGLPLQLKVLNDHGLRGVYFVEALFAGRFGVEPLAEVLGLISAAKQDLQLHLHTEWVDEATRPPIKAVQPKRRSLDDYSLTEQRQIIAAALRLFRSAGGPQPDVFRAGNFAANSDTLLALQQNGIFIDSSYNFCCAACRMVDDSAPLRQASLLRTSLGEITVYPMSHFSDYPGHYRHLQIGACSSSELQSVLYQALEKRWHSVVLLFHGDELLVPNKNRVDDIVYKRFTDLCKFLDSNRDLFATATFEKMPATADHPQPPSLNSTFGNTARRMVEQARRRLF